MSQKALPAEIEMHLRLALTPSGDRASLRQRELSTQRLLGHAEEVLPRLLERVRRKPAAWDAPAILDLIARFQSVESVPLLADLLQRGIEETSRAAGRALGAVPHDSARDALLRALEAESAEVRIAAIEGVRLRGETQLCGALEKTLADDDANLRYYAVNAAAALGCLDDPRLSRIAREDADPYVRDLAAEWMRRRGE